MSFFEYGSTALDCGMKSVGKKEIKKKISKEEHPVHKETYPTPAVNHSSNRTF
jgi:hypothetical protein